MIKIKRIIAYSIDMIFLCFLSALIINSPVLGFNNDEVDKYHEAVTAKMDSINYDEYFESEPIKYLQDHAGREFYDYTKSLTYQIPIYIGLYFLYFVVFAYFNRGRTLGLVFLKLRIVNEQNVKPSFISMLVRSLFIGSYILFINPFFSIMQLVLPRILNANSLFVPLLSLSGICMLVELTFFLIFLFNKKDMSVQDYVAHTKILEYKR